MSGRGHWANHMREDMKKDNNSGTLHLTYFHDGFDFGSAIYGNGSVYAVHDGKILYAGWDPVGGGSLGAFIVLQAGNTNVIYQEFSRNVGDIKVSTGQTVKKGQLIGKFTSSHLHLGMTKKEWRSAHSSWNKDDGTWFNPIPILQKFHNKCSLRIAGPRRFMVTRSNQL